MKLPFIFAISPSNLRFDTKEEIENKNEYLPRYDLMNQQFSEGGLIEFTFEDQLKSGWKEAKKQIKMLPHSTGWRWTAGRIDSLIKVPVYLWVATLQTAKIVIKFTAVVLTVGECEEICGPWSLSGTKDDIVSLADCIFKTLTAVKDFFMAPETDYRSSVRELIMGLAGVFGGDYHNNNSLMPIRDNISKTLEKISEQMNRNTSAGSEPFDGRAQFTFEESDEGTNGINTE